VVEELTYKAKAFLTIEGDGASSILLPTKETKDALDISRPAKSLRNSYRICTSRTKDLKSIRISSSEKGDILPGSSPTQKSAPFPSYGPQCHLC